MGQQQTTVASSALRRMVLALLVAALMAALLVATAVPALAKNSGEQPTGPPKDNFGEGNNFALVQHCQTLVPGADPGTNVISQKHQKISCGT
jgi:hypothetical protein